MSGMGMRGVGHGGSFFDSNNFDVPGVPYRAEHFIPRSECPYGIFKTRNAFTSYSVVSMVMVFDCMW